MDKSNYPQQDFDFGCGVIGFGGCGVIDSCALASGTVCMGCCVSFGAGFVLPPQQPE